MEFFINNPEKCLEFGNAGRGKYLSHYTLEIFEKNLISALGRIVHNN